MVWWGLMGSSLAEPGLVGKQQLGSLSQGVAAQGTSTFFWPKASTNAIVMSNSRLGKSSFLLDAT
jgi:hypothetical protein